jgi:hypothetical protein
VKHFAKHSTNILTRRSSPASRDWAPCPLARSSRALYERRRQHGDTYSAAARHLANRFVRILYHCLQKSISYDETKTTYPNIKIAA